MTKPPPESSQSLTSRDVARMLGVSQSMISRAFNPKASVSPARRSQIIEAVTALGYRPNVIARSLSTGSSRIVAMLMGTMENPFYAYILERFSRELQKVGYQSLLFTVPPSEEVDNQLPFLMQYNVDAIVIASAVISSGIADTWARLGRKAILINRTVPHSSAVSVSCDNYAGGRLLAGFLVDKGYRRIAFAAGRPNTSTNTDRQRGFVEALLERGLRLSSRSEGTDFSFDADYAAALQLAPTKPDAIFFANDIMAIGGIHALRHGLGLRVPEDIAVVGFDDIPMAAWPWYSLTTVRQPVEKMIEMSISFVLQGSVSAPARLEFPGELVEREST